MTIIIAAQELCKNRIKRTREQSSVPSTRQNFEVLDVNRAGRNLYKWISFSLSKLLFLSYNVASRKIFGKLIGVVEGRGRSRFTKRAACVSGRITIGSTPSGLVCPP